MTWVIDSGMYYAAAEKCHLLAGDISLALGPLLHTLTHECGGMAGDHKDSEAWTTTYNKHTADIITLAATLANALQRFGDVLAANGYNWWHSNRAKASGPEPDRPTASEPLYDSGLALPTNAKGDNGPGLDEGAVAGLLAQVGRIPNGDVGRLGKARDAWQTFADHTTITGAADRIRGVNAAFTGNTDPNIGEIEAKLNTLTQAADMLAQASKALVTPVGEHHDALQEMRNDIQAAVADAGKEIAAAIGITVAIVAIAAVASAGLAAPAAAGGGAVVTAEIVATTAGIIKNAVSISRLVAIFGAVVVAGTASGGFTAIPDLTNNAINAAVASIAAMAVHIAADDGATVPSNPSNTPGTPEYAKRVEELAQDPAKNGKVSPQSRREAEVGLSNENAGRVGPLERAHPGPNGEDTGEFVDTDSGIHWDVKSSPDVIPDYRPADVAGKPIPNPQTDDEFIEMIEDSLADGEGVMIDQSGMTEARKARLRQLVESHPEWQGKVLW
ncbi:hypothetical protein [Nocardia carnea]|uniref:hypothetical protein n=1 Tax=Nocardia carnea TaxID=37328 RepID=UPI0024578871|nr:hypothetical protein [Nocardia carnea]